MLPLRELQQRFAAALYEQQLAPLAAVIRDNGISAVERIACYRNNLQAGFRKALALSFPVIERLVGEAYFTRLAREYQAAHPSRSGDLHHVGAAFAAFLHQRHATDEYAYLGAVAALEWACQEIAIAERIPAASVEQLRQLDPGAYDSLPLALHPAVRPVSSDYPIVKIWLANQPGAADEVIHLDAGGDRVLVCESHDGLEFHRLSDAEFALAEAAGAGATLGEAAGRALAAADESFDLVRSLQHLLGAGALVFPTLGVRSHENH